jgi:CheY-like chemotaxis protein
MTPVLLVAEDDETDALLLERALRRGKAPFRLVRVSDGNEAIDYVSGRGAFADRAHHPAPHVVLLDLKMPRKDGFDVLRWRQKAHGTMKLPIIVFSSSELSEDIDRAFSLGANSYVVKSAAPGRLEHMLQTLHEWWVNYNRQGTPLVP